MGPARRVENPRRIVGIEPRNQPPGTTPLDQRVDGADPSIVDDDIRARPATDQDTLARRDHERGAAAALEHDHLPGHGMQGRCCGTQWRGHFYAATDLRTGCIKLGRIRWIDARASPRPARARQVHRPTPASILKLSAFDIPSSQPLVIPPDNASRTPATMRPKPAISATAAALDWRRSTSTTVAINAVRNPSKRRFNHAPGSFERSGTSANVALTVIIEYRNVNHGRIAVAMTPIASSSSEMRSGCFGNRVGAWARLPYGTKGEGLESGAACSVGECRASSGLSTPIPPKVVELWSQPLYSHGPTIARRPALHWTRRVHTAAVATVRSLRMEARTSRRRPSDGWR